MAARRADGLEAGAGLDFRDCEYLLGTSAGSIVAATLAGRAAPRGRRARRARVGARAACPTGGRADGRETRRPLAPSARGAARVGRAVATPLAPLALATTAPAGRLARAAVLRRAPRPERTLGDLGAHIEALGARFDGRLRISAVDRASGRRVIFGAPDAPRATRRRGRARLLRRAVDFAPVEIGEREYVDGGVWSPTNLDAVPAGRGSRVLVPDPDRGRDAGAAADGDRRRRGLRVDGAARPRGDECRRSSRTSASLEAIGPNLMDPSRRARGRRRRLRAGPPAA